MASTPIPLTSSLKSSPPSDENSPIHTQGNLFDKTPERAAARAAYLKIFLAGTFLAIVVIFTIFLIFWNALAKTPAHSLPGWIVDFDGGQIGQEVIQVLKSQPTLISWTVVSAAQFPLGVGDLSHAVLEEQTWVAVAINGGSTARLTSSLASPNASYNGADAITVFAVQARNENAYAGIITPSVMPLLNVIAQSFALQNAERVSNSSSLPSILSISPQTIIQPVSYTVVNLAPFDAPVAEAVTFIGLIFQIVLSFFIVIVGSKAREVSGLEKSLFPSSLIALRFGSIFGSFLTVSLFYSLLSVAFQLQFTLKFGQAGFVVFWMVNFCGMLTFGLALESLLALLPTKLIPVFMLTWIILNISVCLFPVESMPNFYRYGFAVPLYNMSRAMRTIIFGTKNAVGMCFGIILAWTAVSSIIILLHWYSVRRRSHRLHA